MSTKTMRNWLTATVMALGTTLVAQNATASDCSVPRYYWKTVVSYETVRQPVPQWVTKYDHCGKPYRATVTVWETVRVPVEHRVKIYY